MRERFMQVLVGGALALLASAMADPPAARATGTVDLRVEPLASGVPIEARVRVVSLAGTPWPAGRDSTLLSHRFNGFVYHYPDGATPLRVPTGPYIVQAWHGPEWYPAECVIDLLGDSVITVPMQRMDDLRARGWYSGDTHVHTLHPPLDYPVTLAQARRELLAEDVAVTHLLDQSGRFTGGPDPSSDSLATIYCSIEYRNQTGGHLSLLGLRADVGENCCQSPQPAWPMLIDIRDQVVAQGGMVALSHPHNTDAYEDHHLWPGAGLGRELPVTAALGRLDAMDVVAYTNDPDTDWAEWYDLLSAGIDVPATAGSDGPINWYTVGPPGGWRVYARVEPGAASLVDRWIAAARAGRTFVTSGPLVPVFDIAGVAPGGLLNAPSDTLERPVRIEVECAIGLEAVSLVADGLDVWTCPLQGRVRLDTTITLRAATPRWLALRADGVAGHHAMMGLPAVAHTSAVRVLLAGDRRPIAAACARLWDGAQRFEDLAVADGTWTIAWQLDSLRQRCGRAKALYGLPFTQPPGSFAQVSANLGTTTRLCWTHAPDPEADDRVLYQVELAQDTTFAAPVCVATFDTATTLRLPDDGQGWWWRVTAVDRGGQRRTGSNAPRPVEGYDIASAPEAPRAVVPRAMPNPSRGVVRLEGFADDVRIHDLAGRRVAWLGRGIRRAATGFEWDPDASASRAPAGTYFARSPSRGVALRLTRLR